MNHLQRFRPNELLYINLGSLEPFYKSLDIPKAQLEREKRKILVENNSSILPEVIFHPEKGKYLVVGGYTTFYAYAKCLNSNKLVPCKAFYHLTEGECYLLTLDWVMNNNITNWYNRHNLFIRLMIDFNYTQKDLTTFLGKSNKNIQYYLFPPLHIDDETIRQKKESIINSISLEAFRHGHNKDFLYIRILYYGYDITLDQLKYIGWLRGNGIKFEERNLTLEQEHQLMDKAINLKENFLKEIKVIINDMRVHNGDNPMF